MSTRTLILLTILICVSSNVKSSQETIIFGTENYAPFSYKDPDTGEIEGLSVDIVRALLNAANDRKSKIKIYPWARIYNMALQQKNIAIFSIVRLQEREKLFNWAGTLYNPKMYIWKLASRNDIEVINSADLKNYKIAVNNQGIDEIILTKRYGLTRDKQLQQVSQTTQKLFMLLRKRTDLIEYGELALQWKMNQLNFDFDLLKKVMILPDTTKFSLAFSKQTDDKIVARYQKALEKIKKNGIYDKIVAKWQM